MKVLVVGGGGREHALVWSLSRSRSVAEVICAPGNPGIAALAECVGARADDTGRLRDLVRKLRPDLVVVGPEGPLLAGLADALKPFCPVFGPSAEGARLEGSKSFAKGLMASAGIPTASAAWFDDFDEAVAYVRSRDRDVVVKADGLAAGKGVVVCEGADEAVAAIEQSMLSRRFGDSGLRVVIEDRLYGPELSILAFCDGKSILPMQPAQDFKRALDGDRGPNTGGMGSYSPVPVCTAEVSQTARDEVLEPVAAALAEQNERYVGVIYAGLMLTEDGLKVIEFNCRFGDPETQAILPRLNSDLAEVMLACTQGGLAGMELDWRPEACVSVVAASDGYPGSPRIPTGFPIKGLEEAAGEDVFVFHSGTGYKDGEIVTAGGRVVCVSALGQGIGRARERAYESMAKISFHGMQYRSDIAQAAQGAAMTGQKL